MINERSIQARLKRQKILDVLNAASYPLRRSDITRQSGIHKTSVGYVLNTLLDTNEIERNEDGAYIPLVTTTSFQQATKERRTPQKLNLDLSEINKGHKVVHRMSNEPVPSESRPRGRPRQSSSLASVYW
jgi:DNA-binding IclR family transcriptional regulator